MFKFPTYFIKHSFIFNHFYSCFPWLLFVYDDAQLASLIGPFFFLQHSWDTGRWGWTAWTEYEMRGQDGKETHRQNKGRGEGKNIGAEHRRRINIKD